MMAHWYLSWRNNVEVTAHEGAFQIKNAGRVQSLKGLPQEAVDLLLMLQRSEEGAAGIPLEQAYPLLPLLGRMGHLVDLHIVTDNGILASRQSTVRQWQVPQPPVVETGSVRLNRFALVRSLDDEPVLECPVSTTRWVLRSAEARQLATQLSAPLSLSDLEHLPAQSSTLLRSLIADGLVEHCPDDQEPAFPSDTDATLKLWDFHDLLMHSRTRSGRFDAPLGALSLHRDSLDPLPAEPVREKAGDVEEIPLSRPDLNSLANRGMPLQHLIETRRSIRDYAEDPMDVEQLSGLLYRSCRIRAAFHPPVGSGLESKISRPYPSGGGLYEHEFYVTVRRCTGLTPGVYRYDGRAHALHRLAATEADTAEMMNVASAAMGSTALPDVLITVTSRFQRMSWRYSSIAYANTLRNTGAIYQTLYLVAASLGLAPCALGNGDADLAARVFGLDYLQESSVGDFALGRAPAAVSVSGEPLPGWELLDVISE